jgi:predicted CopG family antitoxin
MKAASIQEIKQELQHLNLKEVQDLCLRLAKYKKDNKELLGYLLFQAHDEESYIQAIKDEIDELFTEINTSHVYFAKKSLRKILRIVSKHTKYSGHKQTEVEVLLHFCQRLKLSDLAKEKNAVIHKLYLMQVKKVQKLNAALHEDLQYDYLRQLENL